MAKDIPVSCGCTAAVAVIRWEGSSAPAQPPSPCSPTIEEIETKETTKASAEEESTVNIIEETITEVTSPPPNDETKSAGPISENPTLESKETRTQRERSAASASSTARKRSVSSAPSVRSQSSFTHSVINKDDKTRVLYTANVGDARVVLCRGGKAFRLSYDHKGSDPNESARITNCGGIMYANRVNGMLAVTRSLGDGYMKSLVTGSPYTTRTELGVADEFIIIACDGIWDVCSDQAAVELIRDVMDPKQASQKLVKHAIDNFSSDNITCMVIRLDPNVCTS